MLRELFKKEQENINYFFENFDFPAAEKLLEVLKECKGLIILTGVGKSSLVAQKIAVTLTSTGTRAFFLDPLNALHGDIGIVSKEDVFLFISKSGESDELLQIVPFLRNKGVKPIAILSKPNSRLAKACEFSIVLPMQKELCPFDLVPTISSVIQMILGDALSVALMMHKNFSLVEYAKNHPAGKIGRSITLKVSDLMLRGDDVPFCAPGDKLVDTLVELSNKKCGCVIVTDKEKHLLGVFTDGDLRRSLQKHGAKALDISMGDLMTKTPRFIKDDEMASAALNMMEADQQRPITNMPVINKDKQVVGIIKMHDIVQSGL